MPSHEDPRLDPPDTAANRSGVYRHPQTPVRTWHGECAGACGRLMYFGVASACDECLDADSEPCDSAEHDLAWLAARGR